MITAMQQPLIATGFFGVVACLILAAIFVRSYRRQRQLRPSASSRKRVGAGAENPEEEEEIHHELANFSTFDSNTNDSASVGKQNAGIWFESQSSFARENTIITANPLSGIDVQDVNHNGSLDNLSFQNPLAALDQVVKQPSLSIFDDVAAIDADILGSSISTCVEEAFELELASLSDDRRSLLGEGVTARASAGENLVGERLNMGVEHLAECVSSVRDAACHHGVATISGRLPTTIQFLEEGVELLKMELQTVACGDTPSLELHSFEGSLKLVETAICLEHQLEMVQRRCDVNSAVDEVARVLGSLAVTAKAACQQVKQAASHVAVSSFVSAEAVENEVGVSDGEHATAEPRSHVAMKSRSFRERAMSLDLSLVRSRLRQNLDTRSRRNQEGDRDAWIGLAINQLRPVKRKSMSSTPATRGRARARWAKIRATVFTAVRKHCDDDSSLL